MIKSLIKKKTRTDILSGAEADEFARLHTAIYNGGDVSTMVGFNSNHGLLKSVTGDKYYVVQLGEVLKYNGLDDFARVEKIRLEPLTLNLAEGQQPSEAFKGYSSFDVSTISSKTGKPEVLYFGEGLIPFKSEEDRVAHNNLLFEVYRADAKFKSLEKLTEYLTDENFVIATKDAFREYIYETEFEPGFIEGKKLLYNANKALDVAAEKAKQGTLGGN